MKKAPRCLLHAGFAAGLFLLSSCATRPSADQWKLDDARYKEQLKRYPDREGPERQKADARAARIADNLAK